MTEETQKDVCVWSNTNKSFPCRYETGCNINLNCLLLFYTVEEEGFEYCPYCGEKIEVKDD